VSDHRSASSLLASLLLEVVEEDGERIGLFSVVLDDDARAAYHAAGLGLLVELAKTDPLSELLGLRHLDQVNVVLSAEGLHKLAISGLIDVLGKDAKVGGALVKGLGALGQSAGQSVVDEGLLENLLQSSEDVHDLGGLGGGSLSDNISIVHFRISFRHFCCWNSSTVRRLI